MVYHLPSVSGLEISVPPPPPVVEPFDVGMRYILYALQGELPRASFTLMISEQFGSQAFHM